MTNLNTDPAGRDEPQRSPVHPTVKRAAALLTHACGDAYANQVAERVEEAAGISAKPAAPTPAALMPTEQAIINEFLAASAQQDAATIALMNWLATAPGHIDAAWVENGQRHAAARARYVPAQQQMSRLLDRALDVQDKQLVAAALACYAQSIEAGRVLSANS